MFIKYIRLHKELFLLTQSTQHRSPLPWATGATAHTGYSRAALAGDPNDQAAKAAVSVPERVRNYAGCSA